MFPNYPPKILTEEQIRWAINNSQSLVKASQLLSVDYRTFKKYSSRLNLFTDNRNQGGKGIKKKIDKKGHYYKKYIEKILSGNINFNVFIKGKRNKLLRTLIEYEYLTEKCEMCEFNKKNKNNQVSLLLDFKDGNYTNFDIKNLRPLCPNCYSVSCGDIIFIKGD